MLPYHPCMVYLSTFTYIYHINRPSVAEYTIHGLYGVYMNPFSDLPDLRGRSILSLSICDVVAKVNISSKNVESSRCQRVKSQQSNWNWPHLNVPWYFKCGSETESVVVFVWNLPFGRKPDLNWCERKVARNVLSQINVFWWLFCWGTAVATAPAKG